MPFGLGLDCDCCGTDDCDCKLCSDVPCLGAPNDPNAAVTFTATITGFSQTGVGVDAPCTPCTDYNRPFEMQYGFNFALTPLYTDPLDADPAGEGCTWVELDELDCSGDHATSSIDIAFTLYQKAGGGMGIFVQVQFSEANSFDGSNRAVFEGRAEVEATEVETRCKMINVNVTCPNVHNDFTVWYCDGPLTVQITGAAA